MGKFGECIGIWHLTVGGADLHLKPKIGDNYKLFEIMNNAKKSGNESLLFKDVGKFLKELIDRDDAPANDEEKEQAEQYVELNIAELIKETLVRFRWTTKEKYDQMEGEQLKNVKALTT